MDNHIVHKQIDIKATPEEVWDALTNPEKTKEYFFHCRVFSDWKPGSPITFKGKMFLLINIEMHGTIIKAETGKHLEYILKNRDDENESQSHVTDLLSYNDGITTLSVTDNVGSGEGAEERYKKSIKGWDKVLEGLKELVENDNQ